jgi:NAD(P)-dependent dehydrogenase (short-subunit alcohol dehydrogenase family)
MGDWTAADIPDQSGRHAIVTGANSGLGFHVALGLARSGARVVLACRSAGRGQAALERVQAEVPGADAELRLSTSPTCHRCAPSRPASRSPLT